ncbi:MAG: hypothetical protein ACPG7F_00435 [Aggregatilineales bacterium]
MIAHPLDTLPQPEAEREMLRCAASCQYFINCYIQIYDAQAKAWIPFRLWAGQVTALDVMLNNKKVIALKPRQIGITWLVLAIIIWMMIFRPVSENLVFSRREDEALYLLSPERLRGMYRRLPAWMRTESIAIDDKSHLRLSNGSGVRGFPSNAGDSYTATLAFVDEADLVPDLDRLLRSVEPTVEAGGKLIMISRADKSKPQSRFKKIYRAATARLNDYANIFLPWHVHPERDGAWYQRQCETTLAETGSLDDVHEQYPATSEEALSSRSSDKRIARKWLKRCYIKNQPAIDAPGIPAIPGLTVYHPAEADEKYVIGADPAEGKKGGDNSAFTVGNAYTGEEVAALAGIYDIQTFAEYIDAIGTYFNNASVMVERNNHGHAVLLWLRNNSYLELLEGHDGNEGWLSSSRGKAILYTHGAGAIKDGEAAIYSEATYLELVSIERETLRAPTTMHDDRADSFMLMLAGCYFKQEIWSMAV